MRVNLPQGNDKNYLSKARGRITNLSLTVVTLFIFTNLPYMIDEFIRQEILTNAHCYTQLCSIIEVSALFV